MDNNYKEYKKERFEPIPVEFQQFIESYAYEHGHSAGESEVNMIAGGIAADFLPYLKRYNERMGITKI